MSQAEIEEIKGLMSQYQPNQLRLPLHAAVMISPLYLLAPIQLFSVKWDRRALFLVGTCVFTGFLFLTIRRPLRPWGITGPPFLLKWKPG